MTAELNRLRWRCQRGMLELDHILRGFLDTGYLAAPPETQRAFESLLSMEDADILDLVMGRTTPVSGELVPLLALLQRRI
ncbi:MAG: succinate dehydrogenase assembly factor 2 [Parasulfuritortus sp.]|nr:succinate dehydrogenase assembly factor 2 [Parasulfuritortus sp.]